MILEDGNSFNVMTWQNKPNRSWLACDAPANPILYWYATREQSLISHGYAVIML
jgi:hypothetical protein